MKRPTAEHLLAAVILVWAASCGWMPEREPAAKIVATAEDHVVTLADFEDYLDSQLQLEEGREWEPEAITPEVRSRLLDELIDEVLMAEEAANRGITVTSEEIERWIAGGPEDSRYSRPEEERRRIRAKREILVQKLLAATARAAWTSRAAADPEAEPGNDAAEAVEAVEVLREQIRSGSAVRIFEENLAFPYLPDPERGRPAESSVD